MSISQNIVAGLVLGALAFGWILATAHARKF
jgi:hypothetical protein